MSTVEEIVEAIKELSPAKRIELLQKLNKIPGVNLKDFNKYPTIKLSALTSEDAMDQFIQAIEWTNDEVSGLT